MELLPILIITNVVFFIGYFIGKQKGVVEGKKEGFVDGMNTTFKEVEKLMNSGLTSTLDWETTQRLLNEKMSRN